MNDLLQAFPAVSRVLNGVVLGAIAIGICYRYRPRAHIPIMVSCLVVDFLNVLAIELSRGAIETAMKTATTGGDWILKIHIFFSLVCVACYGIAVWTGLRLWRRGAGRKFHRINASVFLCCRVLSFLTSLSIGGS